MTRFASALLAAVLVLLATHPVRAQSASWPEIACADSKLKLPDAIKSFATCAKAPYFFEGNVATSECEQLRYSLYTKESKPREPFFRWTSLSFTSMQCYAVRPMASAEIEQIKRLYPRGTDWGEPKTVAGATTMEFTSRSKRNCFAFRKPGPDKDGGYAWVVAGYYCKPTQPKPAAPGFTEEEIKQYLALAALK
jgi:hypothetical protein